MQNHLNNLPKRLKKYITIERKLEIISDFKEQEFPSKRKFALDYGISTKQLRYYLANETNFQEQKAKRTSRIVSSYRTCPYVDEENEVHAWFKTQRAAKIPVAGITIRNEMRSLVEREHPELSANQTPFKASIGWFMNFLKRKRLSRRRITTSGRPFPSNSVEILNDWIKEINDCIEEFEFSRLEIVHMDETSIYMDMPGTYTYDTIGTRRVEAATTGKERTRISCAYTASASGNKLDILGVIKRANSFPQMVIPENFIPIFSSKGKII